MFSEKKPVIYIGYDSREASAYEVLRESILRYTHKYDIIPLVQTSLRRAGLYRRTIRLDIETGSPARIDEFDCRPFSTDFTFTRFLIPALNQYSGWALFMDSDMFLRTNIEELFEEYTQNEQYAIQCVHHNYNPSSNITTFFDLILKKSIANTSGMLAIKITKIVNIVNLNFII